MRIPVIHRKDPARAGAAYVGRPSLFGNPFKIRNEGDRAEVIKLYEEWFLDRIVKDAGFRKALEKLKTATALVCWCAPKACHGDVIAEWLERNS